MDSYKNFAISVVNTLPVPPASGNTLKVLTGHGARFGAVPFNATVWPKDALPDPDNATIIRVTAIVGDELTFERTQESTNNRVMQDGDLIAQTITEKTLDDLQALAQEGKPFTGGQKLRGRETGPGPSEEIELGDYLSITDGRLDVAGAGQTSFIVQHLPPQGFSRKLRSGQDYLPNAQPLSELPTGYMRSLIGTGVVTTVVKIPATDVSDLPPGPEGPQGEQGPVGPQGVAGPQGVQGSVGLTGATGDVGATGPAGPQGPQGLVGPVGPQGPQGLQGDTGSQGDQGVQGPVGATGVDGAAGPQGPEGLQGIQGVQGVPGPEGPVGPEGAAGAGLVIKGTVSTSADLPPTGVAGEAWLTADDGHLWMWDDGTQTWVDAGQLQGPVGPAGPQGIVGPQGPVGPEGPQGPIGVTGATGVQGPQGVMGPVGPQGGVGAQGPQGVIGPVGPQGDTGPQGVQGVQGVKGDTGEAGPQGIQGETGAQGPQGAQGLIGPVGATGVTGPEGPQGVQGVQGVPGAEGPIGPQGETSPSASVFPYRADVATTTESDPGTGLLRWNNVNQLAATALYRRSIDASGL